MSTSTTITDIELIKAYVKDHLQNQTPAIDPFLKFERNAAEDSNEPALEAIEISVGGNKNRKLRRADVEKFSKTQTALARSVALEEDQEGSADGFQSVYKVWSAFTKTIRSVIVKYTGEDITIKTHYFGKFYAPLLDKSKKSRIIVYQPPVKL